MKNIVITGATRGIGFGVAKTLLDRGCRVTICGRSADSTAEVVSRLAGGDADRTGRVQGTACDVAEINQVEALWTFSEERFGPIDIWLNNAALTTPSKPFTELTAGELSGPVNANILGTLNGCRVAMRHMMDQGGGFIYTYEGLGSRGERRPGTTVYGMTKRAVHYLTESLIAETKGTVVKVGSIQPGMVPTGLFVDAVSDEGRKAAYGIMNILGDTVDTVAPWIADSVLTNTRHGVTFRWLTTRGIILRFLAAPFRRRRVIET